MPCETCRLVLTTMGSFETGRTAKMRDSVGGTEKASVPLHGGTNLFAQKSNPTYVCVAKSPSLAIGWFWVIVAAISKLKIPTTSRRTLLLVSLKTHTLGFG